MKVSIVIPWYNNIDLVEGTLSQVVAALKNQVNQIIEVIVVDDCSSDESSLLIKKKFPEIVLIKHKVNRGFSATINTGVRAAKGDLVCLLNSDVTPSPDFLKSTLDHFKNPKVFGVSLNESGNFGWAKGFFSTGFINHGIGGKGSDPHITFWVSGGSGLFRRKTWMELGGMDEKLFTPYYWEDIDLSYRAMKRGYQTLWEPKAKVNHKHETSISKIPKKTSDRIRERNQLLFIWKNVLSPTLIRKHIGGLFKRLFSHPGYIVIVVLALAKLGFVLKARAKESKEARVSDEAILARFNQ